MPMTMFHVLLTIRMANADLKIQRKNMELSKSDEYCQDGFSNETVNTLQTGWIHRKIVENGLEIRQEKSMLA